LQCLRPRPRTCGSSASERGENTIAKFSSSGAGSVFSSFQPGPEGLTFDGAVNFYVANDFSGNSPFNKTIEKFASSGVGTVFASESSGVNWPAGLAFDSVGNLYAALFYPNLIEKFDSSGAGTVFTTSGLNEPIYLAFQPVPEPSTWALLACGLGTLLSMKPRPSR
jgi:DNA-binding beta-propeller fold protein YncE